MTPAEQQLQTQLDAALGPVQAPAGLIDAVLGATCEQLPAAAANDAQALWAAQLDRALAPAAPPAGLVDAVLAATRESVTAAGPGAADQLDRALAVTEAPAGLVEAVLDATRDQLPAPAPVGRIGFDRGTWGRGIAVAALVAFAVGAWWVIPAGDDAGVNHRVASHGDVPPAGGQAVGGGGAVSDLDPEIQRLLEPFETIDSQLAQAALADHAAAGPVALLSDRLAAVADADVWSGAGLDGIDIAMDWEVSFETAEDGAWLF